MDRRSERHLRKIKASLERKGLRIEDFDVAIAAHALANDATLVTGNVKHMAGVTELKLEIGLFHSLLVANS